MKQLLVFFFATGFINVTISTVHAQKSKIEDAVLYNKTIVNLVDFFDKNAYDSTKMSYLSEISNEGKPISDKVYTVALNRCIYGLSYSSQFYPENLRHAQQAATFLLNHLIGSDAVGKYFFSYIENNQQDTSKVLDIWQQAYGLCGLTELYRITNNKELLSKIHVLHDALLTRFQDKNKGGFFGNYNIITGQVAGSKTLQSLMYPITAYMANLWLADTENRQKYEPIIKAHLKILSQVSWNKNTQWVNLNFDDSWQVCVSDNAEKPCFMISPGYNFQLASLFLRTANWGFISKKDKAAYQQLGIEILDATFKKPIFYQNNVGGGFYSLINPITNQVADDRKAWWQHCEAIIALSMCQKKYATELKQLKEYFFNNFQDSIYKGEYFNLSKDNKPITTELKGAKGKSLYHTIEMIRFLKENERN